MLMVSYSWFLLLGTVGWRASLLFVRHIYRCASNIRGGLTANFTLCADCFTLIAYQLSSASLQDELTPRSAAVAVMTFLMPESP